MAHRDFHPTPVESCFGCRVLTISYDGRHLTKTTPVVNELTGRAGGSHTDHRDGRRDAVIQLDPVRTSIPKEHNR